MLYIFLFVVFLYSQLKQNGLWFQKDITDKHVFLTGAGSGLGRLLAIRLAKKGAKLSLVDINYKGLEETRRLII
jgi:D-arabinose 1-dehydrogenase-like Zn-dependent alcohol dehydrogenase